MCTNRSVMIHCSRSTFQESSSQQLTEKKVRGFVGEEGICLEFFKTIAIHSHTYI